jgi:hypothetical protein
MHLKFNNYISTVCDLLKNKQNYLYVISMYVCMYVCCMSCMYVCMMYDVYYYKVVLLKIYSLIVIVYRRRQAGYKLLRIRKPQSSVSVSVSVLGTQLSLLLTTYYLLPTLAMHISIVQ